MTVPEQLDLFAPEPAPQADPDSIYTVCESGRLRWQRPVDPLAPLPPEHDPASPHFIGMAPWRRCMCQPGCQCQGCRPCRIERGEATDTHTDTRRDTAA